MPIEDADAGLRVAPGVTTLVIVGAGGHARVVVDAARQGDWGALVLRDDDAVRRGQKIDGVPIETPALAERFIPEAAVHVAIGHNETRRRLCAAARQRGAGIVSVVHPDAIVSAMAALSAGCFIAARSVVGPGACLGEGCIVNHGAIVDHDCNVGDWVHVAPGAILGGEVHVGSLALIGAGAVILPRLVIGEGAVIGAGAVVTKNVAAGTTVVGNPARSRA